MLSASSRSRRVSEPTLALIPATALTSYGQAFSSTFALALEPRCSDLPSIASTSG
jgi:hypothetical protein